MEKRELILRIETPTDWDHLKFALDVANHRPVSFTGCGVYEVCDAVDTFRDRISERLKRDGLSTFLGSTFLGEEVVSPSHSKSFIASLMVDFLKGIGVDRELIIVDPYFYARTTDPDYITLVRSVVEPFFDVLNSIYVVTLPNKVDQVLKQSINQLIVGLKPTINIHHKTSVDYHDRFWISSHRTKGIVTGSSLNGLGRKYALIDQLNELDVTDIVDSLQSNNLI